MPITVTDAGTFQVTRPTWIDIDGVPLATPAWRCLNPLEVLKPAPKRTVGGVVIPRAHGRIPRAMFDDAADRLLTLQFYGARDRLGARVADARQGLIDNLVWFRTNVVDVPATLDSTRTLTLHLISGTTWSGEVQVLDLDWPDDTTASVFDSTLSVFLTAGRLELDS